MRGDDHGVTRVGVIGTGMMGCEHLRNLLALPSAAVTAFSDPNERSRGWARRTLGDSADAAVEYADHHALLAGGLVDAVVVASPNHTHAAVLADVLATDLPVLVEKPLCTTVADCQTVVTRAAARRAITWVGLEYRYLPTVQTLLGALRDPGVGRVRMVSVREHRFPFLAKVGDWNRFSRNTGGTLVEKCCHFFDLMNLVMAIDTPGTRPRRVLASGGQDVNHLDERYDGEVPDILDNAYVIVEYSNGARACLDLCMFAEGGRFEQELTVVGEAAKLETTVPGSVVHRGARAPRVVDEIPVTTDDSIGHVGFHHGASYVEVRAFVDAVQRGEPAAVTPSDGLWSVAVGAAAHQAIDEARPVTLAELGLSDRSQ